MSSSNSNAGSVSDAHEAPSVGGAHRRRAVDDDNPVLRARNVDLAPTARGPAILESVSLSLIPGRLHGIAGPNGSGKTTLISALAGFLKPHAGIIELGERNMSEIHPMDRAQSVAVVLTDRTDTAFLHVDELVALGRLPFSRRNGLTNADRQICADAMDRLGLTELRRRRVATLSDGERQRALIARAIAQAPTVLLLDEPTAHLDVAGEVEIISHLLSIAREENIAVLACSHKLQLMLSWCDTLSLVRRNGSIVTGAPEELALRGEVSNTFDTPMVRFNASDLRFNTCRRRNDWKPVTIRANDEYEIWTRRALERLGFVEQTESPLLIEVFSSQQSPLWRLSGALPGFRTGVSTGFPTGVPTGFPTGDPPHTQNHSDTQRVEKEFTSLQALVQYLERFTLPRTSKQDV